MLGVASVGGVAIAALFAIFLVANPSGSASGVSPAGSFQVGSPGPGSPAPPIRLAATTGGVFDLSALRGQNVLLYFQEGIMCPPCWDQLKDIEHNWSTFRQLDIDRIVGVATDPLDLLRQRAADQGIATPVLSDPNLSVSRAYHANNYGMTGGSRDGHTFVLVGRGGTILWRADYGGAPNYTMYVPVPRFVADIRAGLTGHSS